MDYVLKIRALVSLKKITIEELANKLTISKQALHNILGNRTSLKIEHLEKIAKVLEVPVSYFFEEDQGNAISISTTKSNDIEQLQKEIENLKEQLSLKNQIIELLKK